MNVMNMKTARLISVRPQAGFSLIELMMVCAILALVMATIMRGINTTVQRSQAEQTKVDLTQEGREFVDEFERDVHQVGYPNCRMVAAPGLGATPNCPADSTNLTAAQSSTLAVGLVYVSNTKLVFEGDVDGDGIVDTVVYRLVDSTGSWPPVGNCPCVVQRSQMQKVNGTSPWSQPVTYSQELQNVVNSGVPQGTAASGNGLPIAGSTAWGASNSAFYGAVSSFKDYPVFQAYDQSGNIIALPLDLSIPGNTQTLTCSVSTVSCVKSIRLTINLLANANTGVDLQTKVRPVTTMVGNARLVNN
jgi:prepilin-type N-terminal cleavage/methylation domain-containing protein